MANLNNRAQKVSACLVNTVTDPAVAGGVANLALNWDSAGIVGAIINIGTTCACIALRLHAERQKFVNVPKAGNAAEKPAPVFFGNPRASFFVSGASQIAVAGITLLNGDFSNAAAAGKTAAAVGISTLFGWGGMSASGMLDPLQNRIAGFAGKTASKALFSPEISFGTGLTLASGPAAIVTGPIFIGSSLWAFSKAASGKEPGGFLQPLTGLATGSAISALTHAANGVFGHSAANMIFSLCYISLACQKNGGVWETVMGKNDPMPAPAR